MIQLDILCIGFLERDDDGDLVQAHSTSTLIRAEGRNIVVDTSTEYMWPAVKTSFRQIGIFPEDVDTIILTHTHSDHVGNLKRYPKAKVLVHKGGKSEIPGARIIEDDEFQVCPGVRMVHTPGHCTEETSVFVEADRHYICAGDAIPLEGNLKERKAPTLCTDRRLALESIDRIRDFADVVIPGHDAPFMVRRSQFDRVGRHVGIVVGQGFDAVRIEALLADPSQRCHLPLGIHGDPGTDHLFP